MNKPKKGDATVSILIDLFSTIIGKIASVMSIESVPILKKN